MNLSPTRHTAKNRCAPTTTYTGIRIHAGIRRIFPPLGAAPRFDTRGYSLLVGVEAGLDSLFVSLEDEEESELDEDSDDFEVVDVGFEPPL